jgi:dinuclear metal center YbgI/SA1388 family protein
MNIKEIDSYFRSLLPIDDMERTDISLNGLQVSNKSGEVRKAAFAVDASMESFKRAAQWGADILFVHHGLFWGKALSLTGSHFERIRFLIENNLALYACHLPLDMDSELGNNISVAKILELDDITPFGEYRGKKIGYKGLLKEALSCEELIEKCGFDNDGILSLLKFGPDKCRSIGIITGGACKEVEQAVSEELDLYLTGEISHQIYHQCLEDGINVISAGHYATEIFGVKNVSDKVNSDLGLETVFIDLPTGL